MTQAGPGTAQQPRQRSGTTGGTFTVRAEVFPGRAWIAVEDTAAPGRDATTRTDGSTA
jgi:hypothetical protein